MAQLLPTFRAKCNARTVGMSAPFLIRPDTNQVCKGFRALAVAHHVPASPWRRCAGSGARQARQLPSQQVTPPKHGH